VRLAARLLVVVALLFAQAAGLAHEIDHAGAALAAGSDGDAGRPKGSPLCDFHTALGTVLGALDCAAQAIELASERQASFAASDLRPAQPSFLPARSRGPPALR
jgi:hypothetical protein